MQHAAARLTPDNDRPDGALPSLSPGTTRCPGAEPIPGYRLLEPLGQGGFGEVWKCEAPGGLFKAIKFVSGTTAPDLNASCVSPAEQEFAALQRVKTLRHPFILSLERVEVVDNLLFVVMELADHSLHQLLVNHQSQGQAGIPRDDLLGYLLEAAEALDWMNFEHGLQHLDVKPHNLFLISGHVKVADFGLVHQFGAGEGSQNGDGEGVRRGGVTPAYGAPELLRGTLSRHSDQYSLAVVYQQLLTGTLPFWHKNVYDLMMQHLSEEPNLGSLSEPDRSVVARALAKTPAERYPSCMEFVQALLGSEGPKLRRSGSWRRVLVGDRANAPKPSPPPSPPIAPSAAHRKGPDDTPAKAALPLPASVAPLGGLDRTMLHAALPGDGGGYAEEAGKALPTAVTLPGYRFTSCINQTPLGDLWQAEDAAGRPRRALCLLPFVRYDARLISHLQALRDPLLPAAEVHWSPAERLVVLTDWLDGTLRDRFEQHQANGQPGIPREELLRLLRSAAEAVDALYARHGLQHLGLNPRNLLLDKDKVRLADFGLIPLVWLPTGQSAALLNSRYAAVELFDRRPTRGADQFSLALIYAEMLTGVHPRPQRPEAGSGRSLRSAAGRTASGRSGPSRVPKIDLDLLPGHDRDVVARALANDAEARYPSCVAFVEALEEAGKAHGPTDRYDELPAVIPFATLMGEEAGPDTILPPVEELVQALTGKPITTKERPMAGHKVRYAVQPDGSWEYRCPLQVFTGAMQLKVEGFRAHWGGRVVFHKGELYRLHLDVPIPRSFWERVTGQPKQVIVEIHFSSGDTRAGLTEALVRISYPSSNKEQRERILTAMGPKVLETARTYLQATTEQRSRERVPVNHKLHVYPVLPDLDLSATLEGQCKDVSQGGVRFRVPEEPVTEYLYLHFHDVGAVQGYAILARKVRAVFLEGAWEVGAEFLDAVGSAMGAR